MDGFDLVKPGKIICIEREQVRYSVDDHGRDQSGVMHLLAGNIMGRYKITPCRVNERAVRQENHAPLERPNLLLSLSRGKAKGVSAHWTCGDIPKLRYVLMCKVQDGSGPAKRGDGIGYQSVVRTIPPQDSQENVAVDQMGFRGCHQSCS